MNHPFQQRRDFMRRFDIPVPDAPAQSSRSSNLDIAPMGAEVNSAGKAAWL